MARHNQIGKWGEDLACDRLTELGYAIARRNWHMGHYEIDIIAMRDTRVVFCEVKTRTTPGVDPLEAVDRRKIARMVASARAYMLAEGLDRHTAQFDLFAIVAPDGPEGDYTLEHIPDAFEIPLSTTY